MKVLRQAANIVMCFYTIAFQYVRINRTLGEEFNAIQFFCFLSEDVYEFFADDLTLRFRITDTGQLVQKAVNSIDINQIGTKLIAEHFNNLLRLSFSKQAVVDMHTGKLVAHSFDQQSSHHRRIYAAGECKKDFTVSDLRF